MVLLLLASHSEAATRTVLMILSKDGESYRAVAHALKANLQGKNAALWHFEQKIAATWTDEKVDVRVDYIVAIGTTATQVALAKKPAQFVLSVFIPESAFSAAVDGQKQPLTRISAIYLDQPMFRLIKLGKKLLPNAKQVGFLISDAQQIKEAEILEMSAKYKLNASIVNVTDSPLLDDTILDLVTRSDFIIALPDPVVNVPRRVKKMLHYSKEKQVPIIGFSKSFVYAGALASVFSTPESIGRQAAERVERHINGKAPWPITNEYPIYFDIAINKETEKLMGVDIPNANILQKEIIHSGVSNVVAAQ